MENEAIYSVSQLPIDSVAIFLSNTTITTSFYSDSLCVFDYVILGRGVQGIVFKKDGYDTKFLDINFSDNPTDIKIELEKQ